MRLTFIGQIKEAKAIWHCQSAPIYQHTFEGGTLWLWQGGV